MRPLSRRERRFGRLAHCRRRAAATAKGGRQTSGSSSEPPACGRSRRQGPRVQSYASSSAGARGPGWQSSAGDDCAIGVGRLSCGLSERSECGWETCRTIRNTKKREIDLMARIMVRTGKASDRSPGDSRRARPPEHLSDGHSRAAHRRWDGRSNDDGRPRDHRAQALGHAARPSQGRQSGRAHGRGIAHDHPQLADGVAVVRQGRPRSRVAADRDEAHPISEGPRRWETNRWAVPGPASCSRQPDVVLDATMRDIAIPSDQNALHFSRRSRQWDRQAPTTLASAASMLGAVSGDLFGRKGH